MPTPSTQDIRQMQQNSPEFQNRQMLAQKWQSIFSNEEVCKRYVGWAYFGPLEWNDKNNIIPVPHDQTERVIAEDAANKAIKLYPDSDDRNKAGRKFLRVCARDSNKFTKQQNKAIKKNINAGYGAYDQDQVIPKSNTPADIKAAAEYAGRVAATAELQSGEHGSDQVMQTVNNWLNDKMYNVFFYRAYLTGIVNKATGRGFTDDKKEAQRREILNSVSQACTAYENELNQKPGELPDNSGKRGLEQLNDAKQKTSRYPQ